MEGLLGLLGFGLLFYLMMRFGCGAHMVHGHGTQGGSQDTTGGVDPVCGMPVAADGGYTKMFRGTRFWFCSKNCLDNFESDPEKYLQTSPPGGGHAA